MKKFLGLILTILLLGTTSCSFLQNNSKKESDEYNPSVDTSVKLDIMTTDKLLYSTVKTIVKNKHTVNYMFKNRYDELNFDFTYDSLSNVSRNDLFIYVGSGYEPWIDNFVEKLNKNKVGIINSSRGVRLLSYENPIKYKNTTINQNPYYFMDISNYKVMLVNIKNSVEDKDPQNRSLYEKNFSAELKKLSACEKQIKDIDKNLTGCNFITSSETLKYFTNYNNLNMLDINTGKDNKIMPSDPEEAESVREKLKSNTIFLYTDDSELKANYDTIKEFNIKTAKIKLFDGTESYENVVKYNMNALKKYITK